MKYITVEAKLATVESIQFSYHLKIVCTERLRGRITLKITDYHNLWFIFN